MKEFGVSRKKVMVTLWWLRLSQSRTIWFCIPRINNPRAAVLLPLLPNLKETKLWKTTQQWPIWEEFATDLPVVSLFFCSDLPTVAPRLRVPITGLQAQWWLPGPRCCAPCRCSGRLLAEPLRAAQRAEMVTGRDVLFPDTWESQVLLIKTPQKLPPPKANEL